MTRIHFQFFFAVALFVAGYLCEGTQHLSRARYILDEIKLDEDLWKKSIERVSDTAGAKVIKWPPEKIERGSPTLNDFGIFDMKPLLTDYSGSPAYHVPVDEINVDCKNLEECREKLQEGHQDDIDRYKYFILPDGKILEGKGLDYETPRWWMRICFPKLRGRPPTMEAMEAFAFLMRIKTTLGRVDEEAHIDFKFTVPDDSDRLAYINILNSNLSVTKKKAFGDVEFLARDDWGAVKPIRKMNVTNTRADLVKVTLTNSYSTMPKKCLKEVQRLQRDQMRKFSDVFSNFIICGDGRVYEGLGWDLMRKENTVYFDFLVEPDKPIPWTQVLAAFTLKLREGIVLGKISKEFAIVTPKISDTISNSIITVGSLAKSLGENKSVVALKYSKAKENVPSREFDGMRMHRLAHPISSVRFIQSEAICDAPNDCVPFSKMLDGEAVMSPERLTSNFYFFRENVVYEGFGWEWTLRQDEVALEFPTVNHTLPSKQAMLASMLLIREGVMNGYLRADYKTKVGKDTSEEFRNQVRFWDKRVRG